MSKVNINGTELELDLLDADAMEKYQTALNETTAALNEAATKYEGQEGLHVAESMRLQCQLTEAFIDKIFGEGTAKKCFKNPNHLGEHLKAFTEVCNHANLAVKQTKDIIGKYSGERLQNRQQRRAQQHNKKNHNAVYPVQ